MTNWSKRTTTGFKSGNRATKTTNSSGKVRNTISHNVSGRASKKGQGSIRITNTIDSNGRQRTYKTTTSPLGFRTTETLYKSPPKIKTEKPKKIRTSSGRSSKTQMNYSSEDTSGILKMLGWVVLIWFSLLLLLKIFSFLF